LIAVAGTMAAACSNSEAPEAEVPASPESPGSEETGGGGAQTAEPDPDAGSALRADVVAVATSGTAGAYNFAVTLQSPDTGCEQYADWWEVITPDGALLYRRILAHSHVDEQPFTRSGGPVDVPSTRRVIVRAHMNDAGYGGVVFSGSVEAGFAADPSVTAELVPELAEESPLPNGCAF
jgi:hypothetical protein